jgi:hypothetical protein
VLRRRRLYPLAAIALLAAAPALAASGAFSTAVLPDTQNMIDYRHQKHRLPDRWPS